MAFSTLVVFVSTVSVSSNWYLSSVIFNPGNSQKSQGALSELYGADDAVRDYGLLNIATQGSMNDLV